MDYVSKIAVLIVLALVLAPAGQPQDREENATAVHGSGFFFSPNGYLLTNFHVVKGCQTARLKVGDVFVSGSVLASDAKNDLALLRSEHPSPSLVFREDQRLRLGENIIVVGYPLAGVVASSMNLTTGTVSALSGIGDDTRMIQFTAPVQPGNSGGPLLDQSGHVVGIVTSKLSPLWTAEHLGDIPQNVNFAIKSSVVRDFLDSKGIEYSTAPSTTAVPTTGIAEQVRNAVVSMECVPGLSGGFLGTKMLPNAAEQQGAVDSNGRRPVQRLRDLGTITLGSLGTSVSASLVREKLINRLAKSGRVLVVDDPDKADAVLTGVVGANIYGRAQTAAFRLVSKQGQIMWVSETNARGIGSASSRIADKIANELLKAIEKDGKPK